MKKIISGIMMIALSVILLVPAYAIEPVGNALLAKVVVDGVTQTTTNPEETIGVTVTLKNLSTTSLQQVMVSVNGLSSSTLSLTNTFGPFSVNLDATKTGDVSFDLFASPTIVGGNYPLSLTLTYVGYDGITVSVNRDISILVDVAAEDPLTATPLVVVSSYTISQDKVKSGDQFELTFTLLNTSTTLPLTNMLASFSSAGSALTPISGASNQLYIGDIAAGGSYTAKANLLANSALPSGTYDLNIGLQYQDALNNTYNTVAAISIPIKGTTTVVKVAAPQVVVTSYDIGAEQVFGGDAFELTLTLKNTSADAATNVLLSFLADYNAFISAPGVPNQQYIGKIAAGDTYTAKIQLQANDTLESSIYNLAVNLQYQGANTVPNSTTSTESGSNTYNSAFSSTASISIKLEQTQKLTINSVTISDTCVLGSKTLLSVNYENPGTSNIKNLVANLSGDILATEKTVQIGTVQAMSTGFIEQSVTPQSTGPQNITVSFTFEDDSGNSYTTPERSVTLTVLANEAAATPSDNTATAAPTADGTQTDGTPSLNLNSYWIYFVLAGIVLVAAAGIVWRISYLRKKKTPKWSNTAK